MSERNTVVLDASALLALLNREPGYERVESHVLREGAVMSAVNLSEVVAKNADRGIPASSTMSFFYLLGIELHAFQAEDAEEAGRLRAMTKSLGLSFADRACLALAVRLKLPVITADQMWGSLPLPIDVVQIR